MLEKPLQSILPEQSVHTCILIIIETKKVENGDEENEDTALFEVFKYGKNALVISVRRVIWMRISTMSIMMAYITGEILKMYDKEKYLITFINCVVCGKYQLDNSSFDVQLWKPATLSGIRRQQTQA